MNHKEFNFVRLLPFLITFLALLLLLFLNNFFNLIYFEEYESYLTTMLSGEITPGTNYNHFYYYCHIGLSFLYFSLYNISKLTPWIPLFYESILGLIFVFFITVYFKDLNKITRFVFTLLTFILLHEHFLILNITRVSFVTISLGGLILLNKSISKKQKIVAQLIMIFGLLTRSEPAFLCLFLIATGDFLINQEYQLKERIKRWIIVFWPVTFIMVSLFIFFQIDFKTSNEFYKQIEPDVEYELMVRENFIPIPKNADSSYTHRYQAVKLGFWGDSKLNDNLFLRSLIDKKGRNNSSIINNNFYTIKDLLNKNFVVFTLLVLLYFICSIVSFKHSKKEFLLVNLIIISVFLTILIVTNKVKMVDRGFVTLLSITCFIYLIYLKNRMNLLNSKWLLIPVLVFSVFQIYAVQQKLDVLRNEVRHNKKCLNHIKPIVASSEFIFLGQSSTNVFFLSQTPFGTQTNFKNVYLFNALAFVTVEPYRSYLEKKYKCNPNDYKAFFDFAASVNSVFLLNEEESSFLENYLRIVHKFKMKFIRINQTELKDATGTQFYAYKLLRL